MSPWAVRHRFVFQPQSKPLHSRSGRTRATPPCVRPQSIVRKLSAKSTVRLSTVQLTLWSSGSVKTGKGAKGVRARDTACMRACLCCWLVRVGYCHERRLDGGVRAKAGRRGHADVRGKVTFETMGRLLRCTRRGGWHGVAAFVVVFVVVQDLREAI